jgi:hypothetical protein
MLLSERVRVGGGVLSRRRSSKDTMVSDVVVN